MASEIDEDALRNEFRQILTVLPKKIALEEISQYLTKHPPKMKLSASATKVVPLQMEAGTPK